MIWPGARPAHRRGRLAALIGSAVLAIAPGVCQAAAATLPPGVSARPGDDGLVLVDAQGKRLYRLDLDHYRAGERHDVAGLIDARCARVCAKLWRPVAASKDTLPGGDDWGIASRADGLAQLTYKGSPLYTFAGESLDEAADASVAPPYATGYSAATSRLRNGVPVNTVYWHEALYEPPPPKVEAPAGVQARWDKTAYVYGMSGGGKLYSSKPGASCSTDCPGVRPLSAPLAALSVGAWRPKAGHDGQRVWSYRGRVVYQAQDPEVAPGAAVEVIPVR